MDQVDQEILSLLQVNGRLSLTELARSVRVSLSSCHRRLRALESSGAISGYRAQIDPKAIGLGFDALVFITMDSTARETFEAFERTITTVPRTVELCGAHPPPMADGVRFARPDSRLLPATCRSSS